MTAFDFREGVLHAEDVPIPDIVAAVGSPVFIYSRKHFTTQLRALQSALHGLDADICYAVKANANVAILRLFNSLGAGFDIVSAGELQRVLAAGGNPEQIVFSGVGKSVAEIDLACKLGIRCFNVESAAELERLAERAALLKRRARFSLRVNPDVDAATHPYISTGLKKNKFGVPMAQARQLFERSAGHEWLDPVGIACHIGSQIARPAPLLEAVDSLLELRRGLLDAGFPIHHLDLGGGFGVTYDAEPAFDLEAWGNGLRGALTGQPQPLSIAIEPGRFLVANGGILVTTVEYLKPAADPAGRNFAVVDAAMNDLLRPALYQAWHRVENVHLRSTAKSRSWDIVGPVCESGDWLALDRSLDIQASDLLAIHSAGAYGMVLASNYNSRPRAAEVLVDGDGFQLIRRRETSEDLLRLELADLALGNSAR